MIFLLTWHGTLLCRRRRDGIFVHRPLADTSDDIDPVVLDMPIEQVRAEFGHHLGGIVPELPDHPPGALQSFHMRWTEDQRTLSLRQGDAFLSAEVDSDVLGSFRTEAGDLGSFLPVSQPALDALRELLGSKWLVRSSGAFVEQAEMWRLFHLRLGDLLVDLRYQVPFDLANWPFRLTLLREGWRIDQICLYRPLVFYSAFGPSEILEQFAISVRSLIEVAHYRGRIAVLTDRSKPELAAFLPESILAQLTTIQLKPHDRPGFMAARYLILDWDDAWKFQPILYVDVDIVFDRDVTPMLHAIAMSDHIAAPIEHHTSLTDHAPSGAALLQRDLCSPGYMAGFNTGTLGIPNLRAHAEHLRLIRRVIANHSLLHGRHALPYGDQEVANYVSFRLAHFDTGLISSFVRYGGTDAHLGERRGLVHFWPVPGPAARTQAMRDYLARLQQR